MNGSSLETIAAERAAFYLQQTTEVLDPSRPNIRTRSAAKGYGPEFICLVSGDKFRVNSDDPSPSQLLVCDAVREASAEATERWNEFDAEYGKEISEVTIDAKARDTITSIESRLSSIDASLDDIRDRLAKLESVGTLPPAT